MLERSASPKRSLPALTIFQPSAWNIKLSWMSYHELPSSVSKPCDAPYCAAAAAASVETFGRRREGSWCCSYVRYDHVVVDVVHLRGVARAAVLDVGDEGVPIPAVDRPARKPHANLSRAVHGPNMRRDKSSFGPCPWSPVSLRQQTPRGEEEAGGQEEGLWVAPLTCRC